MKKIMLISIFIIQILVGRETHILSSFDGVGQPDPRFNGEPPDLSIALNSNYLVTATNAGIDIYVIGQTFPVAEIDGTVHRHRLQNVRGHRLHFRL